jgi:hypothetical protein
LGATLTDADLTQAQLVGTELADATMTRCRVFGSSVWQVGLSGTLRKENITTPPDEAAITVDNLEVAQSLEAEIIAPAERNARALIKSKNTYR